MCSIINYFIKDRVHYNQRSVYLLNIHCSYDRTRIVEILHLSIHYQNIQHRNDHIICSVCLFNICTYLIAIATYSTLLSFETTKLLFKIIYLLMPLLYFIISSMKDSYMDLFGKIEPQTTPQLVDGKVMNA